MLIMLLSNYNFVTSCELAKGTRTGNYVLAGKDRTWETQKLN